MAGNLKLVKILTVRVHHAEIIAQLGEDYVVTGSDTKELFHLFNLMQQRDLPRRRKEAGFNGIGRQFS